MRRGLSPLTRNGIQSQDWNEALDAVSKLYTKFDAAAGHKHTGGLEDSPPITTAGIADGAVTAAKLAAGAIKQIGVAFKADMLDGDQIPIPAGFVESECIFFAAISGYGRTGGGAGAANFTGKVETIGRLIKITTTGSINVSALGVALAKKGGW